MDNVFTDAVIFSFCFVSSCLRSCLAHKITNACILSYPFSSLPIKATGGGGSGSTHSGNGVDSSSGANGAAKDQESAGQEGQASTTVVVAAAQNAAAAAAVAAAAAITTASTSGKEDTPTPGSSGPTERSTRPYKPRFNCIERHLIIRK